MGGKRGEWEEYRSEGSKEQVAIGTPSFALQFWRKSICGGTKKLEFRVEEPVMAWVHSWAEKEGVCKLKKFTLVKVIFAGGKKELERNKPAVITCENTELVKNGF